MVCVAVAYLAAHSKSYELRCGGCAPVMTGEILSASEHIREDTAVLWTSEN
jgi:hypothetical protein